jgi:hypothetical protein
MRIPAITISGSLKAKPSRFSETDCAKRLSGKLMNETKRATDVIRSILFIRTVLELVELIDLAGN